MKNIRAIFLIAVISPNLFSQTEFSGGIFSDTKWTRANSPYIITGNVVIFPSKTLTIEPGVEVRFDGFYYLEIRGNIIAIGNNNDSITFTSNSTNPNRGDWIGMPMKNAQGVRANFEYCKFLYAKDLNTVEICENCDSVVFKNCLFNNIDRVFSDYGARVSVDRCKFINNRICFTDAYKRITNSSFINNEYALYETESINVNNSIFSENNIAIYGRYCRIEGCSFTENNIAIKVWLSGIEIYGNTIENNGKGIILSFIYGNQSTIRNNKICNNEINVIHTDDQTVELRSNCWCTSDSSEIEDKLIDGYDDLQLGLFNYDIFTDDCNTWLQSVIKVETNIKHNVSNDIIIYPNPFKSNLVIEMTGYSNSGPIIVEIKNILGQLVYSEIANGDMVELQLDNLDPGMYICLLKASNYTLNKAILKQ